LDARELDTNRLSLRLPTLRDFEDSAAMLKDEAVIRHIGGKPFTREEAWMRVLRHVGHWQLLDFGFWVVREKRGGGFVGHVGLGDFRREMTPTFGGDPEIGWVLAGSAHGKGYATEAAQAAIEWMCLRHRPARMVCMIEPENAASLRVAAKCGFHEFARTTYKNSAVVVLERGFGHASTAERP
jgi:RimJ/RimL family protein N-acetyltransferase